jgi:hypothetical protein
MGYIVNIGNLYIDKNGVLRIVMEDLPNNLVRGIDVSNMTIDGIILNYDLTTIFSGTGNFDSKRNKVIFK